ncbi:Hypothetical predicted protein [Mytilus galloprovincialis]|uniref:Uncharacterized protein n=1 Tax=Mytilus galloprovincialis TaxID=29158 RepID=A0A8B6DPX9_MYTGA|nr:Hypothetical predicted protein [Mytilus galloprovincialis]
MQEDIVVDIQISKQQHRITTTRPPDLTCEAWFVCCCCIIPLGAVAIALVLDANSAADRGDFERARVSAGIAGILITQTVPRHSQILDQEYNLRKIFAKKPKVENHLLQAEDGDINKLLMITTADACTKLTDYLVLTWIEGRYPQPTWNHHLTEGPRTNNHLEGWHNKLKKRVKTAHPNIFEIINVFKKEQAANEVKKVLYAAGGKMRGKAKKYRKIEERFATLKASLHNGTKDYIQYGDAASYILKLEN